MDNQPIITTPTPNETVPVVAPTVTPAAPSPDATTPSRPKFNQKILIGGFALIVLLLTIIGVALSSIKSTNKTTPPTNQSNVPNSTYIKNEEVIGQVGNKQITGTYFNAYLNKYYPTYFDQDKATIEEIATDIKNSLSANAAMVLAAKDENIITEADLNNYFSDPSSPNSKDIIDKIRTFIDSNSEKMDYYILSIWYYNMYLPEIPLAEAESLALSKITTLHNQVQTKKITIYQAGDLITQDTELAKLDNNYRGNAMMIIGNATKSDQVSRFLEIDKAAKNLKAGEISPVIKVVSTGKPATGIADIQFTENNKLDANEMFFTFVKADNNVSGKYQGLENWINQAKVKYPFKAS